MIIILHDIGHQTKTPDAVLRPTETQHKLHLFY